MEMALLWVCVLLPLCLLPGHLCLTTTTTTACSGNMTKVPPATSPTATEIRQPKSSVVTVQTKPGFVLTMRGHGSVKVEGGPTSVTVAEGDKAVLECRFKAPSAVQVSWHRACSHNYSEPTLITSSNNSQRIVSIYSGADNSILTLQPARRNDTGLYFCQVHTNEIWGQSCGTYLRIRKPVPVPFLNMKESTKNQIITAEGVLLLFCAVGPGLFLLFRKRWENERLLQAKKSAYEEENLYEGLNLDECSMYEDISRGLQSTYQDVANIRVLDMQLERP